MYWIAVLVLFFLAVAFVILGIWAIAHTDTFFCFIKEGQGMIVRRGLSFHRIIISYHGHKCEKVEKKGTKEKRWEIIPKGENDPEFALGFLGFLEKRFGIHWIGIYPFYQRMEYEFRWKEWKEKESDNTTLEINSRKKNTNFFYVQTFNYALFLSGAETGGSSDGKKNVGGNIPVDARITLLVQIVYPQIAILQNEDWFEQLEAVVLDHARLYVGSRTFEQLHTSAHTKEVTNLKNEFCEHIMKLNDYAPIGEKTDGVKDAFGIKIVGAVIASIELTGGNSKEIAKETTAVYVAEQKAKGIKIIAEAEADKITKIGKAEADAIKARSQAVADFGETGMFVERQRAIIEAGKAGNTIVFTNDNEHDEKNKMLAGLLVDAKGRKIK